MKTQAFGGKLNFRSRDELRDQLWEQLVDHGFEYFMDQTWCQLFYPLKDDLGLRGQLLIQLIDQIKKDLR